MNDSVSLSPPLAIGGVGGSGTRLIAEIVEKLGYYIGSDLNHANDNLWFSLLFRRPQLWPFEDNKEEIDKGIRIFLNAMRDKRSWSDEEDEYISALNRKDRPTFPPEWAEERMATLRNSITLSRQRLWGWKEPNTHIFLPLFSQAIPDMKYIHVMRHGLDMAFSENQNQLKLWGKILLKETHLENTPATSFRYWCAVHRKITRVGASMPGRFLLLNYDKFCMSPREGLRELTAFLSLEPSPWSTKQDSIISLVKPPGSIGRHLEHDTSWAKPQDLALLESLGY